MGGRRDRAVALTITECFVVMAVRRSRATGHDGLDYGGVVEHHVLRDGSTDRWDQE